MLATGIVPLQSELKRPKNSALISRMIAEAVPRPSGDRCDDGVEPDLTRTRQVTSRDLSADVSTLQARWLGKKIPYELAGPVGRKAKLAAMLACIGSGHPGICPAFSPLSGITQWMNAVVLWVNVGGNTYENVFYTTPDLKTESGATVARLNRADAGKKALYMSWFAQRRQTEDTPVIQLLVRSNAPLGTGVDSAAKMDSKPDSKPQTKMSLPQTSVLLFCRRPDDAYVYCGGLKYVSHGYVEDPTAGSGQLLRFIWELSDSASLLRGSDLFCDLVGIQG
jgi:hypothetical protein